MKHTDLGMVHLTPAERYFRNEISLDEATRAEIRQMREERAETRFGTLNVLIRVFVVLIALPIMLVSFFNPRRWC
jgi:hypothetical protein